VNFNYCFSGVFGQVEKVILTHNLTQLHHPQKPERRKILSGKNSFPNQHNVGLRENRVFV